MEDKSEEDEQKVERRSVTRPPSTLSSEQQKITYTHSHTGDIIPGQLGHI